MTRRIIVGMYGCIPSSLVYVGHERDVVWKIYIIQRVFSCGCLKLLVETYIIFLLFLQDHYVITHYSFTVVIHPVGH